MTTNPVALSRDLPAGRVLRAEADGIDLAVWRDSQGRVAAWDNRCPHRGMRLSHGFVRGDRLACLYHGWQYGTSGRCRYIPAHPDLDPPDTIRTTAYEAAEAGGVIWVASEGEPTPSDMPDGFAPLRSLTVLAAVEVVAKTLTNATETQVGQGNLLAFSLEGTTVAICLNPLTSGETDLHCLVGGEATLAEKKRVSRWLEMVRRMAEGGGS